MAASAALDSFCALRRRAAASAALASPRRRLAGRAGSLAAGRAVRALLMTLALSAAALAPAMAQVGDTTYRLPDPALEERARAVGRELRCLVCQNQSIEDSDAQLARDLRLLVREQIGQGASNEQALRFVHQRYGDFVLLKPPVRGATLILWATPLLAVLGGAVALFLLRRRRAIAPGLGDTELSEAERARLAEIERR